MYAVILAGGGGTRLHPLSRPERPKPFLPLLGERSLLQRTVDRLSGLTDDITVVTDRRYRDIVLEQAPGVARRRRAARAEHGGRDRPRTLVIDRPDDEVMVVLPADQTVERDGVFRDVLGAAAGISRPGHSGSRIRSSPSGSHADRPATEYGYLIPDVARGEEIGGLRAYPLTRFEEKPKPARAEQLVRQEGVAWNAGIFLWRRGVIPPRSSATPASSSRSGRWPAARPASSAPTRPSRSPSRSTTRSWRARRRAARS